MSAYEITIISFFCLLFLSIPLVVGYAMYECNKSNALYYDQWKGEKR